MEGNNRSRLGTVILILLAVVLVVFFVFAKLDERKQVQQAMKEAEEYESSLSKNNDDAAAIIKDLEEDLALPEFVLWGDTGALGVNNSLAPAFESTADTALFEDFLDEYKQHASDITKNSLEISMDNVGVRNEGMNEIRARAGASQIVTAEDITIPAGQNGTVLLDFADDEGNTLKFSPQDNVKFGVTTIDDIEGNLRFNEITDASDAASDDDSDAKQKNIEFVRARSGDSAKVSAGTTVVTELTDKYSSCIPVLYFDSVVPNETAEADINGFVQDVRDLIGAHKPASEDDNYLIIVTTEKDSETDRTLTNAFGDHYYRNDKSAADMTEEDYKTLADTAYASFENQGCFDEIKSEVGKAKDKLTELSD